MFVTGGGAQAAAGGAAAGPLTTRQEGAVAGRVVQHRDGGGGPAGGERDQLKVAHGRAEQQLQASQAQLARCVSQAQAGGSCCRTAVCACGERCGRQQLQYCIVRMGGEGRWIVTCRWSNSSFCLTGDRC